MSAANGTYRAEVDGLRTVAVLPVIAFHAGAPWLPGGFLGVDIFFVISGYLISRILLADLDGGRFSIRRFYERRARRILPALFVVMAFTFPLAWMWLPPDTFTIYLNSLWATALFGSNIFFWLSNGYFQPAAELQPLLHTWSLAVEEQFYLVFPLLLALAFRVARRHLLAVFALLAAASFAACLWQVNANADTAFYLIHARAWELAAGVCVALLERRGATRVPARFAQLGSVLSLALIVAGFMWTSEADAVPGWKTLMPVIGTAGLLVFAVRGTLVARLLGLAPLVGVGLISYSAYLWHHPLFAFARAVSIDKPGPLLMAALAALSLVLAYLSWRFIEQPWRDRTRTSEKQVFTATAAGMALFCAVGVAGVWANLGTARFSAQTLAEVMPPLSTAEDCTWEKPLAGADAVEFCRFGATGTAAPVVLWGDSHARALKDELHRLLLARSVPGLYVNGTSCIRTPGIYRKARDMDARAAACEAQQASLFAELAKMKPRQIIVSLRWTVQVFPVPGSGPTVGFDNGEGGVETETPRTMLARQPDGSWSAAPEGKATALAALLDRLAALAPTTVVGPVPEVGWNVGEANFKSVFIHGLARPEVSTSAAVFAQRNQFVLGVLADAERKGRVRLVWPHKLLCGLAQPGRCAAQAAGVAYYSDDDHLSAAGAALVLGQVLPPS